MLLSFPSLVPHHRRIVIDPTFTDSFPSVSLFPLMRSSHTKASSRTHLPHHAALHRGSLDQRAAPSHQEHHPAFSAPSSVSNCSPPPPAFSLARPLSASFLLPFHTRRHSSPSLPPSSKSYTSARLRPAITALGQAPPLPCHSSSQPHLPRRRSTPLPDPSKVQQVIG